MYDVAMRPNYKDFPEVQSFDFGGKTDPVDLAENLAETMITNRAISLAAPQIGLPVAMGVIGDPTNKETIFAIFNPKVVDLFGEESYTIERCASFPGLFVKVKRHDGVRLRYTDMFGDTNTQKFTGLTSRCVQQVIDHLNGIPITKRATRYHLEQAKRAMKRNGR